MDRRLAFRLVDLADELTGGLIPDFDVRAVDHVQSLATDAVYALLAGDNAKAARLAGQAVAIMTGPDRPKQS